MKILFVDIKYDYGIKSRGSNVIGDLGFKQSFINLGHEVECFYYDDYLNDTEPLQKLLLEKADSYKPDLIFFMLFENQFKKDTLDKLKNKFTTANWFGDDTWRFDSFTSNYANHFTYSITTDKFSAEKYKSLGVENLILSQWAAINEHSIPTLSTNYDYEISFVGGFHTYRNWFVQTLKKSGINVECFGYGWKNGPIESNQMNDIFANSKINLNLSNSTSFDLRYLRSSPKGALQTFRGKKSQSQIKARNFEINYFGGFQLTDFAPGIEDYYTLGKEVVCYNNIDELPLLINYYLKNDEARENIKKMGHEKAIKEHGYINRLKKVLSEISS